MLHIEHSNASFNQDVDGVHPHDALAATHFPKDWAEARRTTGRKGQHTRRRLRKKAYEIAHPLELRPELTEAVPCESFVVWRVGGKLPEIHHETESVALAEAKRLATKSPNRQFVVLYACWNVMNPGVHG